jgi:hypothetical protein
MFSLSISTDKIALMQSVVGFLSTPQYPWRVIPDQWWVWTLKPDCHVAYLWPRRAESQVALPDGGEFGLTGRVSNKVHHSVRLGHGQQRGTPTCVKIFAKTM